MSLQETFESFVERRQKDEGDIFTEQDKKTLYEWMELRRRLMYDEPDTVRGFYRDHEECLSKWGYPPPPEPPKELEDGMKRFYYLIAMGPDADSGGLLSDSIEAKTEPEAYRIACERYPNESLVLMTEPPWGDGSTKYVDTGLEDL